MYLHSCLFCVHTLWHNDLVFFNSLSEIYRIKMHRSVKQLNENNNYFTRFTYQIKSVFFFSTLYKITDNTIQPRSANPATTPMIIITGEFPVLTEASACTPVSLSPIHQLPLSPIYGVRPSSPSFPSSPVTFPRLIAVPFVRLMISSPFSLIFILSIPIPSAPFLPSVPDTPASPFAPSFPLVHDAPVSPLTDACTPVSTSPSHQLPLSPMYGIRPFSPVSPLSPVAFTLREVQV